MSLITDYSEHHDIWGVFISYTIGSVHYEETRNNDGVLLVFKCLYEGSNILRIYLPADRYICEVTGIDI